MRSSVQAQHTDHTKVLLVSSPALKSLAVGLAERSRTDCVEAGPHESLRALYGEQPDLVLVDCGDPEDGCLRAIHGMRQVSDVPIMALIAEGGAGQDALGFGADTISYTPIRWEEFEARLDRMLARGKPRGTDQSVIADNFIRVDRRGQLVTCSGREVALTQTEYKMLVAFICRPDCVLEHTRLMELVWDDPFRSKDEVKLYVSYLRKKFRSAGIDPIETVRGFGYSYRPRSLADPSSGHSCQAAQSAGRVSYPTTQGPQVQEMEPGDSQELASLRL